MILSFLFLAEWIQLYLFYFSNTEHLFHVGSIWLKIISLALGPWPIDGLCRKTASKLVISKCCPSLVGYNSHRSC